MKDLYEVLREKEKQLQQLQDEINILKMAARLLADEGDHSGKLASAVAAPPHEAESPAIIHASRLKAAAHSRSDKVPAQFP